ncbi:hypothetical protein DIJ61_29070 [Burkholderia pseudomallei]|nr:hypothetical protein DIJ61_29070 [Burkholderia pseudomallei]
MRPSGSLRHLSGSFACIIAGSGPGHSTYPSVRICATTSNIGRAHAMRHAARLKLEYDRRLFLRSIGLKV